MKYKIINEHGVICCYDTDFDDRDIFCAYYKEIIFNMDNLICHKFYTKDGNFDNCIKYTSDNNENLVAYRQFGNNGLDYYYDENGDVK